MRQCCSTVQHWMFYTNSTSFGRHHHLRTPTATIVHASSPHAMAETLVAAQ